MGSILCLRTKIPHGVAKKKKRKKEKWVSQEKVQGNRDSYPDSVAAGIYAPTGQPCAKALITVCLLKWTISLSIAPAGTEFLECIHCVLLSFVVPASRTTPMLSVDCVNGGMNGYNTNVNKCRAYRML